MTVLELEEFADYSLDEILEVENIDLSSLWYWKEYSGESVDDDSLLSLLRKVDSRKVSHPQDECFDEGGWNDIHGAFAILSRNAKVQTYWAIKFWQREPDWKGSAGLQSAFAIIKGVGYSWGELADQILHRMEQPEEYTEEAMNRVLPYEGVLSIETELYQLPVSFGRVGECDAPHG